MGCGGGARAQPGIRAAEGLALLLLSLARRSNFPSPARTGYKPPPGWAPPGSAHFYVEPASMAGPQRAA